MSLAGELKQERSIGVRSGFMCSRVHGMGGGSRFISRNLQARPGAQTHVAGKEPGLFSITSARRHPVPLR